MFSIPFSGRTPRMFIPSHKKNGGPATFMRNMKTYLDAVGYPYTEKYKRGDHIFFMVRYDIKTLDKVKKHGGRIVQRLDGVYVPDGSVSDYEMRNRRVAHVYHNYADQVVFQSDWCKRLCDAMIGERQSSEYRIIHNGVNADIFHPGDKSFSGNEPVDFVASGRFKNTRMLNLMLEALDLLQDKMDFRLHLIDQFPHKNVPQYAGKTYVVTHGPQTMQGVADLLRQCHVYLFSAGNPACPNAVLEAVASGLPVVGFNSGSMAELLPFGTELLAPAGADLIQRQRDFRAEELANKILLAVEKYAQFRATAKAHANDYPFTLCGAAYQEFFESEAKAAE